MLTATQDDLIQILEEAASAGDPLIVELRDGRRFADGVCELLRQCGEDYVVFHAHNRFVVGDIARAERLARGADVEDPAESQWSVL